MIDLDFKPIQSLFRSIPRAEEGAWRAMRLMRTAELSRKIFFVLFDLNPKTL